MTFNVGRTLMIYVINCMLRVSMFFISQYVACSLTDHYNVPGKPQDFEIAVVTHQITVDSSDHVPHYVQGNTLEKK